MRKRPRLRFVLLAVASLASVACSRDALPQVPEAAAPPQGANEQARAPEPAAPARPQRVDPRRGGFEVVLGEWAVTPEADAIRPGTVTFVVHNRGTMDHGYEMELEGDSSGPGSGDLFEAESEVVRPGESTRLTVTLTPGVYEIECLVDGHDDMGMEGVLEVRPDAPLVAAEERNAPGRIAIDGFAFEPAVAEVEAGTEVVWRNDDAAGHTVTSLTGEFGSATLAEGATFSHRFDEPGLYEYRCAIHPDMKGTVKVSERNGHA